MSIAIVGLVVVTLVCLIVGMIRDHRRWRAWQRARPPWRM